MLFRCLVCAAILIAPQAKAEPVFKGTIIPIPASVRTKINGVSWHQGCPVPLADLRYLRVTHWNLNQHIVTGTLIVHRDVAHDVMLAFEQLFAQKFPIEKMQLAHTYGGNDALAMSDNNSSAFHCRPITGNKNEFSKHSYGRAIDMNPRFNPYISGKHVAPASGAKYSDRTQQVRGGIYKHSPIVAIFKKLGWHWGGAWRTLKDYQHFEKP